MSNKIFRNPFVYVGKEDGLILLKKKGVEVRYPDVREPVDENIFFTMDYIRYALERLDWQFEWHADMAEEEALMREEEERAMQPALRLLSGGKLDDNKKE